MTAYRKGLHELVKLDAGLLFNTFPKHLLVTQFFVGKGDITEKSDV